MTLGHLLKSAEINMAGTSRQVRKSFTSPDETRPFNGQKGKFDIVTVGDHTVGRGTFEPGWRWSEHVKPIAGTPSCQAAHTGYVLEGAWPCAWMTVPRWSTALEPFSICQRDMTHGSSVTNAAFSSTSQGSPITQSPNKQLTIIKWFPHPVCPMAWMCP
jgi:hypothetical protein